MSETRGLDATVQEAMGTLAGHSREFEHDPSKTILPAQRGPDSVQRKLMALSAAPGTGSIGGALELGATLGSGGMGVVREGRQLRLGRKVAVKTLREDNPSDESSIALLREAWATAAVEHPNIVPVHDVGWSKTGQPLIVFKHIEGVPWSALMHDEIEIRKRFRRSRLDWNLGVLMQVCQAMSFAHSRGIVHRDLKPENVMIGAFGEVNVLDWGIAVATRDSTGGLPLASSVSELAGTPSYMAPEMLGKVPSQISERTDVYLIGAIIYELIVGLPPHRGTRLIDYVSSILGPPPPLPEDAPAELAAISRRAMSVSPADRYPDVESLRRDLEGYLEHRASTRLTEATSEKLAELDQAIAQRGSGDLGERARLADLFGACRFGYGEALRTWPDNPEARRGLVRAVMMMAGHELDVGDLRAAELLIDELPKPPPELVARLEAARMAERRRAEKVEALLRSASSRDPSIGGRARTVVSLTVGGLWVIAPLLAEMRPPGSAGDFRLGIWVSLASFLMIALSGWIYRDIVRKSALNRGLFFLALLTPFANMIAWIGQSMLGTDVVRAELASMAMWMGICANIAVLLHPAFLFIAGTFAVGYLASCANPVLRHYFMSLGNLVLIIVVLYVWRRPKPDPDEK
jgi:hypothetical protein